MWSGLSTVFDKLTGIFGRGFLLAGLLPTLVFLLANAGMTYWVFPGSRSQTRVYIAFSADSQLPQSLSALTGIALLAFVFWSLNPWMRRLLEGHALPAPIARALQNGQEKELVELEEKLRQAREKAYALRTRDWRDRLKTARALGRSRAPGPSEVWEPARQLYKELELARASGREIGYLELQRLCEKIESVLCIQPADQLRELHELHRGFLVLADAALAQANGRYVRVWAERISRFPQNWEHLAPTAMANANEVVRDYASARYGMSLEGFWIRLQKVLKADDQFHGIVELAKTRLDLSVSMTVLTAVLTAAWLVITCLWSPSTTPYLLVAVVGTAAVSAFYGVTRQNYYAWCEVLRGAVDLYRFDVLRTLHVALPKDSQSERALWEGLTGAPADSPIEYQHDSQ